MYKLLKHDTGRKNNRYHYQVVAVNGGTNDILAERHSNRDYVAATINGEFFFGRTDLINKGDHGASVKQALGRGRQPVPIAFLK